MIGQIIVTAFPVLFLIVLFGGGWLFQRNNIDMDGKPPINKALFYTSKYLIIILWIIMVVQSWGLSIYFTKGTGTVKWIALTLWAFGFILLFIGRLGLGNSFRIGSPKESTRLMMDGIYRYSRNPMYLGVDATVLSPAIYGLNPLLLLLAVFVIAVHHKIILAEEEHMLKAFGQEYLEYCRRVRRYL